MKRANKIFSQITTLLIFCFLTQSLAAQGHKRKGDLAWTEGKIKTAVNHYSRVSNILEDKTLLAKRGLGYFKLNKLKRAINDFTQSKKLGNDDPELFFLMAQSKQHLNKYEEAAYFYKEYLKAGDEKSRNGQLALREIKNCVFSAFHQKDKTTAFVESFGKEVNTYYDEVYALQSPRFGNTFYFSSNKNLKNNEVFSYSINEKGEWEENAYFDKKINSHVNEYAMDISTDGLSMLFTRTVGKELTTKIYLSSFDENEKQHIIELPEYLLEGAVDLQIVDYNTIAFASQDLGGYGGYDIFTINYKNGVWSDPLNEGEIINTEYDERSPYFASTSQFLYFSSNRPYCFGGFDVYYYNKLGIKTAPTNMGMPLNSSGNDLHFRLNVDGQMALMSSDRKTGAGAYDIYQVYLQDFKPMPKKDDRQLEYLKDYYNYINPVKEEPQTHLDKLKDKLEEKEAKTTEDEKAELAAQEAAAKKASEELAAKQAKEEAEREAQALAAKKAEETAEREAKELAEAQAKEAAEKEAKELAEKAAADRRARELAERESKEKADKAAAEAKAIADAEAIKKADATAAPDPSAPATKRPRKNYTTIGNTSAPKNTKPAIPQKASDESPLSAMERERKTVSPSNVKFISGEKLKNTILYQDRHDLMNKVNQSKMDKLATYLKNNLDHKVHFVAHTDHLELGLVEFMQYNTLKRANLLAKYLTDNGIGSDRISIESVCSNYPYVKPEMAGKVNEEYLAYNKRVDWELRDSGNQILMSQELPSGKIPSYALDKKHELYSLLREELYYSVEIASSPRIHKNAVLRLFTDIYIRKGSQTADNKYYIGIYNKYEDAVELKAKLDKSSAKYAKIVPFYNGMPISKKEMESIAKDYPDLKKYIASVN